jgi:hypothetical protein
LAEGYDLGQAGLDNAMTDEEKSCIEKYAAIVIKKHPQFNFRTDMSILSSNEETQLIN